MVLRITAVEFFVCLVVVLLCYNCCVRRVREIRGRYRERDGDGGDRGGDGDGEELRRFRERLSERGDVAVRDAESGASAAAARKELIEKNLFSRKIEREESVRELARLLAAARGGGADEELGGLAAARASAAATAAPRFDSSDAGDPSATSFDPPSDLPLEPNLNATDASASSESTLPALSAPQSAGPTTTTTTTIDIVAAAISSPSPDQPAPNNPLLSNPIPLESIHNLWSNLTHKVQSGSERGAGGGTEGGASASSATSASSDGGHPSVVRKSILLNDSHKLECSICLDAYSPGDTISWAKDGGVAPTLSSDRGAINNDVGCDHIFHKECIAAWLQDHDECPLCRRKVVHADADARFASWGV